MQKLNHLFYTTQILFLMFKYKLIYNIKI